MSARLLAGNPLSCLGAERSDAAALAEGSVEPATSESAQGGPTVLTGKGRSGSRPSRRKWTYVAAAVVVVAVVIGAGVALVEMKGGSSSSPMGTVLVPAGTLFMLPFEQYNAVEFAQKTSSHVAGTLTNVGGAQLYLMTPAEYFTLVNTYNVSGYSWTSGPIASDTYYQLGLTIPAGSWDLVFSNSVLGNSTAIGFYSNLVETS